MTSKRIQQFHAPVFKTVNGDRLLVTVPYHNDYLSSRQIKCNWPDADEVHTNFLAAVGRQEYDLEVKHVVQVANTREQTQHRYIIQNFGKNILLRIVIFSKAYSLRRSLICSISTVVLFAGPVVQVLKGQPGDLFGISRSSKGTYIVEKNTDEIKAMHAFFFPGKSKDKKSAVGATKRQAPRKKKAPSATTTITTTGNYVDDDIEVTASDDPVVTTKRRKIGGSSGPTKRILLNSGTTTTTTSATTRLNSHEKVRSMGSLTRPRHTPIPLLPGEVPLGIETFFGVGNYARKSPFLAAHPDVAASAVCTAQPPARYRHAVNRAREGMKKKALAKGGKNLLLRAVRAVELFERICLGDAAVVGGDGQKRITAADRRAACIEYDAVLREIYPELIVDAHVLDAKILENMEGTGT
jgi:hypothetical protein